MVEEALSVVPELGHLGPSRSFTTLNTGWMRVMDVGSFVRVLVYVSFPFVRSDYVISAGVGFRVASGVVASP